MRISATLAAVVGAGVGLVAAGATYAATAGQPPNPSPVSAVAPRAVTATVQPTSDPTCGGGAVLKHDVCVVTLDRTTVATSTTAAEPGDDSALTATSTPATATRSDDADEQASEDSTEHAGEQEHADDADDQGEHAEPGDDHGDGGAEHADD
jgi:hypothetical protein